MTIRGRRAQSEKILPFQSVFATLVAPLVIDGRSTLLHQINTKRIFESILLVGMLLALVVSLWFRIWHLSNIPGINGDEAWQGVKALDFLNTKSIAWDTPSGKGSGPFFLVPLVALHWFFAPSIVLLRSVAVASGVLSLALNFVFCRRVFDRETARVSTLLLAVLPINIAYSRLAWEPSQILVASIPVVYSALLIARKAERLRFWVAISAAALLVALVVHPICIFLLPFPVVAVIWRRREPVRNALFFVNRSAGVLFWMGVFWLTAIATFALLRPSGGSTLLGVIAGWKIDRSPTGFGLGVLRLFSGENVYRYFASGSIAQVNIGDGFVAALMCAVLAFGWSAWRRNREDKSGVVLPVAFFGGLVFFWLLLGAAGLSPANGRYGLWAVLPGVLIFSRAVVHVSRQWPRCNLGFSISVLALSTLLLAGFWQQYFHVFLTAGGNANPIYQTAAQDPKFSALDIIREEKGTDPAVVFAPNWWMYWPMRYDAYFVADIKILRGEDLKTPGGATLFRRAEKNSDLWFAGFSKFPATAKRRASLRNSGQPFDEYSARSYDGRDVVTLFRSLPNK